MSQHHDTASLNELIEVLHDGRDFYTEAASKVTRPDLKGLFGRMASHKTEVASQLAAKVKALGEKPAEAGTFGGAVRKFYAELKTTAAFDKDHEYIAQLEEFEDRILHAFEDTVTKTDDSAVRQIADRYFSTVKKDHDVMRDLKHQGKQA